MKKSIFLIFMGIISLMIGCTPISTQPLKTMTLIDFYEKDLTDVSKIQITDGSTGYKKTIKNKTDIEDFLEKIKDIKFIPEVNQEGTVGWRYSITLIDKEENTFKFGLTEVNGNYYYTEPKILPIVDEFYKNTDVPEE